MNLLADKNVKYDKRFKLLIRGEKAPKESIFDSKKNLIHALKFAYINLFFNMILMDKMLLKNFFIGSIVALQYCVSDCFAAK